MSWKHVCPWTSLQYCKQREEEASVFWKPVGEEKMLRPKDRKAEKPRKEGKVTRTDTKQGACGVEAGEPERLYS